MSAAELRAHVTQLKDLGVPTLDTRYSQKIYHRYIHPREEFWQIPVISGKFCAIRKAVSEPGDKRPLSQWASEGIVRLTVRPG
jgi:hypothetical protein